MKIRFGYVSNSSSSSYVCIMSQDVFAEFEKDFETYMKTLWGIFPRLNGIRFDYVPVRIDKTPMKMVKEYLAEEGIKNPSGDIKKYFYDKFKKEGRFDNPDKKMEIRYEIDTECYDTCGFQEMCQSFIENYEKNKKPRE